MLKRLQILAENKTHRKEKGTRLKEKKKKNWQKWNFIQVNGRIQCGRKLEEPEFSAIYSKEDIFRHKYALAERKNATDEE